MKKYKLTDETTDFLGRTLHRIQALKDFGNVKAGDLGGFVESEDNLSQDGDAWIYDNAKVYGNANVFDKAMIRGRAQISGNAKIYGEAKVFDNAKVYGNASIFGEAAIYNNARVGEIASIYGRAAVCCDAKVYGFAHVKGYAEIGENADIHETRDYLTIGPIGSRKGFTTFYKTSDGIYVACGCFNDDIEAFANAVVETHRKSKHARDYEKAIEVAKTVLEDRED